MEIHDRSYLLIGSWSLLEFHKRVLRFFVVLMFMDCAQISRGNDFGSSFGWFLFVVFAKIWDFLVFCFLFLVGLKALQFRFHFWKVSRCVSSLRCESSDLGSGFWTYWLKSSEAKIASKMGRNVVDLCDLEKRNCVADSKCAVDEYKDDDFVDAIDDDDDDDDGEGRVESCDEDEMLDVMALRKLVKDQRKQADDARSELEKERMASASAAEETMAMIMRLQNEKSSLSIRMNELQRYAEEKQVHDHEVIQSLQWIIMQHESETSLLEDQLRSCREKLKVYEKSDEEDQSDCTIPNIDVSSSASRIDGVLISSLDFDSSSM